MTSSSPANTPGPVPTGPTPPGAPVQARAVRGTLLTLAGQGGNALLRMVSNIWLTHLLFPEAYGIMAIVNSVLLGFQLISDLGTRVTIIQNPRGDDPEFLDTAWTVEILRGAAIMALAVPSGFVAAYAYDKPVLAGLIPMAGASSLITSFTSTKLIRQVRHLDLGRNVALDLMTQVAGLIAMIAHAMLFRSVWSLATGPVVGAALRVVLSHTIIPGPANRLRWDPAAARAIVKSGTWIFIGTTIAFFAQRVDVFMLGKLTDMEQLGVYNVALVLALVPMQFAGPVVNQVILPALAEGHRQNHAELVNRLAAARRVIMPVGLSALVGCALFAPAFFMIAYDPRWHGAGELTQLYMVVTWFHFLTEAFGRALQAMDDARTLAFGHVTRFIVTSAGCYLGFQLGGITGFMVGNAIGALSAYALVDLVLHRHGLASFRADLAYTALGLALGLASVLLSRQLVAATGWAYRFGSIGVGVVLVAPLLAFTARRVLRALRGRRTASAAAAAP